MIIPSNPRLVLVLLTAFSAGACAQEPPAPPEWETLTSLSSWGFDGETAGSMPPGWRIAETNGAGTLATWAAVDAPNAEGEAGCAMAITKTANTDQTYNVAIAEGSVYQDLELNVRVRADSGEEDQGGGPIWRCIDENNYYICRFNPLEENFRVYTVVQGKRTELGSAKVFLGAGEWCTIRVRMVGDAIECYLDDELMLEATDATFPGPGLIGLWTKADAATSFDELQVKPAG